MNAAVNCLVLLLALVGFLPRAHAFPEMVRHGYFNCTACHTSLVGGDILNEYGRSLSREWLSQTSLGGRSVPEGEERPLYGFLKPASGLLLGGDIRILQSYFESKQVSRGRFFVMQVDVDASYQFAPRWRIFASLGRYEPRVAEPRAKDFIGSPRHGLEYLFTDAEAKNRVTLRVGRFTPAYGIAFAEHTFVSRQYLNFGPGLERYAAELAWNDDVRSAIGTVILSQGDNNGIQREKGGILQVSTGVREKSKVGVNYYQSQREGASSDSTFTRRAYGGFAHLGFSKDWYGLLQVDRFQGADEKWGLLEIFKLGYELHQGLHLIGVQEYANRNLDQPNPKFESFSVGTQWFPRPHWDFYALYRKQRDTAQSNDFADVVWLVGHFYL